MPRIRQLIWDSWNIEHIAEHGVIPQEAEETCYGRPIFRQGHSGRTLVIGPTHSGKMLTVVIDPRRFVLPRECPASQQKRTRDVSARKRR